MKLSKKGFISFALALCLSLAAATPAFAAEAADGDGALNPKGDGTQEKESTGAATVTSIDGVTFNTEKDDDNQALADDVGGADINVWAKVIDSSTKIYKVDLAWGSMKFEFSSGAGIWNTATHMYDGGSGNAAWTEADYLDGTNNKVAVTNHSNNAVDAGFSYAMEAKAFNGDALSDDAVVGNFFEDNAKAKSGALILTGTHTGGAAVDAAIADKLAGSKISLPTADTYNSGADSTNLVAGDDHKAGARSGDVFFAFSGTPDAQRNDPLQSFTKVGVITVTVAPNTDASLNQAATDPNTTNP